ncbi:MAG: AMP-binding protein [Galactobacter sp.]
MSVTDEYRAARDFLLEVREDYARARAEFEWPRFTHFNFALDWFDAVAASPRGDQEALVIVEEDGTRTARTWKSLSEGSNRVANWFREIGMKRGDKIIVMLPNREELWEFTLAAFKFGGVVIPTTTQMVADDLTDRVQRGGATWAVAGTGDLKKFDDVPGEYTLIDVDNAAPNALHYADALNQSAEYIPAQETAADAPLLMYFTSGTTSQAKLVEHSHVSYPVGHLSTMYWIGLEPGDIHLNVASPGWGKHAWSNFFGPWIAEATVFVYNYSRFDARALMDQMAQENVTSFCAPPTVWRMLIQADLTHLKTPPQKLVSAGEPLNATVIDRVAHAWGPTIRDGFGQTETTVQIANPPATPVKIGAMGYPMPGFDVILVDPATGAEADAGEICLRLDPRPVGLMKGYLNDAEKTTNAMRGGIYHTGDIAERDENGIITYVGRADDVFKSSDYKLSPFELESVIITHPAVAEAAVVPSPDPIRLSVPKAYVVLTAGYEESAETAEDILGFCRKALAPFKRIRRLQFAELPKTISGKIRRVELRQAEDARHAGEAPEGLTAHGEEFKDTDFPNLRKQ